MSVSVPVLLALAGTALMAVAIFVPFRSSANRLETDVAPVAAAPVEAVPHWPELVEPSATACDVGARLDLVDALASIRSPWAIGVLHQADDEETDPTVRAAIASALARVPVPEPAGSLVT